MSRSMFVIGDYDRNVDKERRRKRHQFNEMAKQQRNAAKHLEDINKSGPVVKWSELRFRRYPALERAVERMVQNKIQEALSE